MKNVIIFDIETDLDTSAVCRGLHLPDEAAARAEIADTFPRLPFHRVVAIGRLEAFFENGVWHVGQIACDHSGDMSEQDMILSFDSRLEHLKPLIVGYNSKSFDLPVLRYRSMTHSLLAPGLASRKYFARYFDESLDLCDIFASYENRSKVSLDLLSRVFGFAGKPDDLNGADVAQLVADKEFETISSYCSRDVILTYLLFLRHELYSARMTSKNYKQSERLLADHLLMTQPHLAHLCEQGSYVSA